MVVKTMDAMNLDELVDTYICKKYGKDPTKCISCESVELCPAGKRAVEIIDDMTRKERPKRVDAANIARKERAFENAKKAAESGDPIKYLMEESGISKKAARERARVYRTKYPELFEDYPPLNTNVRRENTSYQNYIMASKTANPIDWYMNNFGISYQAAWQRHKAAKKKYGAIEPETKKEETKVIEDRSNEEEEVSLLDFLKEHNPVEDNMVKSDTIKNADDPFLSTLMSKLNELESDKSSVLDQIEKLNEKLCWTMSTIDSLKATIDVYRNHDKKGGKE